VELLEPRVMLSSTSPIAPPPLPSQPTPLQGLVGTPNSLDPALIDAAYGFNGLAYDVGGTIFPTNGAGQTIAIVDAYGSPTIINDVQVFDAETYTIPGESVSVGTGLSNYDAEGNFFLTVQKLAPTAGTLPPSVDTPGDIAGWSKETSLDVEWVHAIAPGAHILLVEAASDSLTDLVDANVYAAQQKGVVAVSNSWGIDVAALENPTSIYGVPPYVPSNAPQTLDGYLVTPVGHLDNDGVVGGITFVAASGDAGNELNFPASSVQALSVGGDQITIGLDGEITDFFNWAGSGGDPDTVYTSPAYHEPEVGFDADPTTGVWVYDSTPVPADGATIDGGWSVVGGTSFSAPVWAGVIGLIDQGLALRGIGSLTTAQTLGLDSYDPNRPGQGPTTAYGILGLEQAEIFTTPDLDSFFAPPSNNANSYPLWPKTGPVPDLDLTPAAANVGYGNPNLVTGDQAEGYWGGFIQDMVGGPVGFSAYDTQVIDGDTVPDTLDYFGVTQQPGNATAGATMGAITITAFTPTNDGVDTSFNGPITIQLLGAGSLIGTTTINAVNGSATFSGLSINKTGIYEIEATSPNIVPVDTLSFNVLPAAATHIAILAQPTSFWQFSSMTTSIVVLLEDQFDDVVLGSGVPVTLSINTGPLGGALIGKTSVTTVDGAATFTGLSANVPGVYTLTVSSNGFQPVVTAPFVVVPIPVTERYTLNGAALSPGSIQLQQDRNAVAVTKSPPTTAQTNVVLEENNHVPLVETLNPAVVHAAPSVAPVGTSSVGASAPVDSGADSQLLDTTSSTKDKTILN